MFLSNGNQRNSLYNFLFSFNSLLCPLFQGNYATFYEVSGHGLVSFVGGGMRVWSDVVSPVSPVSPDPPPVHLNIDPESACLAGGYQRHSADYISIFLLLCLRL